MGREKQAPIGGVGEKRADRGQCKSYGVSHAERQCVGRASDIFARGETENARSNLDLIPRSIAFGPLLRKRSEISLHALSMRSEPFHML